MPEQPAAASDAIQNLILGQLARDVATLRALKLQTPIHGERLVVAIASARPLGKATLTVVAMLYGLPTQVIESPKIELIPAFDGVRFAVEEHLGPRVILGKRFVARGYIAVRRQRKGVLRDAAKVIGKRAHSGR